jgi:hypothetical protein
MRVGIGEGVGYLCSVCGIIHYIEQRVFMIKWNMWLCVSAHVSFICCFCLPGLYRFMWKRCNMFSGWTFFSMWSISNALLFISYVCHVFIMCWEYMEFSLLASMAWMCSLNRSMISFRNHNKKYGYAIHSSVFYKTFRLIEPSSGILLLYLYMYWSPSIPTLASVYTSDYWFLLVYFPHFEKNKIGFMRSISCLCVCRPLTF